MNTLIQTVANYLEHSALTAPFFDAWLKSLAVLAVTAVVCGCWRRAAAATRHWLWLLAVASLPCLLLLSGLPHSWQKPLWTISTDFNSGNQVSLALNLAPAGQAANSGAPAAPAVKTAASTVSQGAPRSSPPMAARFSTTLLVLALAVWCFGALLGSISVLAGQIRLTRLARQGVPMQTPGWARLLREASETLRLRRPVRLWQSADNVMPLTWGWWRPVVLLPAEAEHWPTQRRRVVLLHELAHVKRWDCLTQTVARIVRALYWINPLVWLAARRMCVERERACDDLVLNGGCKASDYASQLVEIARTYRHMPQVAAIAMARSSQIKGRIGPSWTPRARDAAPAHGDGPAGLHGGIHLVGRRQQPGRLPRRRRGSFQLAPTADRAPPILCPSQREAVAGVGGQSRREDQRRSSSASSTPPPSGDWQTVTNRFEYFKQHHPQYDHGTNATD